MLENLKKPNRIYPCAVRTVKETLEPTDQKIFIAAVEDYEWGYLTLERELASRGITISQSSLKKHRIKVCSCYRGV